MCLDDLSRSACVLSVREKLFERRPGHAFPLAEKRFPLSCCGRALLRRYLPLAILLHLQFVVHPYHLWTSLYLGPFHYFGQVYFALAFSLLAELWTAQTQVGIGQAFHFVPYYHRFLPGQMVATWHYKALVFLLLRLLLDKVFLHYVGWKILNFISRTLMRSEVMLEYVLVSHAYFLFA